jgi:hypothetical protein
MDKISTTSEREYRAPVWHHVRSGHQNGHGSTPKRRNSKFQSKTLRLCLDSPEWAARLKPPYFDDPQEGRALKTLQTMPPASRSWSTGLTPSDAKSASRP